MGKNQYICLILCTSENKVIYMNRNRLLSVLCVIAFMLVSCGPVKDISYFQNKVVNQPEKIDKHAGIVIQPKDMLSISVSSRNPELAGMWRPTKLQGMFVTRHQV